MKVFSTFFPIINGAVNIRNGVIFFDIVPENRSDFKQRILIKDQIKQLIPWRKGPYNLFGIPIDSEWNCSLKWNRLSSKIPMVKNDIIMDVGVEMVILRGECVRPEQDSWSV